MDFNTGWKFILKDELYGQRFDFDESECRDVRIPHDFSIEQPYNEELGDGCTGYLIGGIAWYRKHFTVEDTNKKVFLNFDGIYNRANIYVNEVFVKFQAYGYSPVLLDITKYLKKGDNLIAVKVDRTRHADSRWYTGSGIYRKAQLLTFEKTYLPLYGVKITTDVKSDSSATVAISTRIENEDVYKDVTLKSEVIDPNGVAVATLTDSLRIEEACDMVQTLDLASPVLWDIYKGKLYEVRMELLENGVVLQEKTTRFGVRDFAFDPDTGFTINGRNELIKGVCLHHDAGLVGSAVPLSVWRRRLQRLIDGGVNAIRTAHNPFASEFFDLCDELGLLVQEEFYDEWDNPKDKRFNGNEKTVDYITRGHHEFFKDHAKEDLQIVVARDINHPSIIQWSIGNEIEWTYPKYNIATGYFGANASGNYFWDMPPISVEEIRENVSQLPRETYEVGETAKKLSTWTKEMDTTRPIIANCILPSASYESGYTDALDIVGFSYRQVVYERCHKAYPEKPIMGAENLGQWHEWKQVLEKDYISGIFLWTGVDYIGESGNVDVWPRKATASGLLDVAGFEKPSYRMFQTLWKAEKSVHMFTQTLEKSLYDLKDSTLVDKEGKEWQQRLWVWQDVNRHYNYIDGEKVVVEVYSNADSVTLYQNGEKISTLKLADFPDRIYKWCIDYKAGELKAVAEGCGLEVNLKTAKVPTQVRLSADCEVLADTYDEVCHIEAELLDEDGNPVVHEEAEVVFAIKGNCRKFGVDNGSLYFVGDHFADSILSNEGKALLILGRDGSADTIEVTATVRGKTMQSNAITIR
ncbi:MAG: glycoside hydrolase family 2 TIM barrel-domain containing protein [Bacillota bacterium]